MENYRSNSHKSREAARQEEKKVEKVISGSASVQKKSELRRFADIFVSEDAGDVKDYLIWDILVPSIRRGLHDMITSVADMVFGKGRTAGSATGGASRVNYRAYYEPETRSRPGQTVTRTGYAFDDVVVDSRGDAETVLQQMDDLIANYGLVSVADLYDLVGINGSYTDNRYGWTNIASAKVVRVPNGYMLKLPKVMPLD